MAVNIKYRAPNPVVHTDTTIKNSPLSNEEIDGNFKNVKDAIEVIQSADGAAAVGFTPTGTVAATNVQSAINEVVSDLSAGTGASLVGYAPAGTGAVATTVQSKLREKVSLFDFMTEAQKAAIKSGTLANNAAAIQAAINHCTENNKTLFIPNGLYLAANVSLLLSGGITIEGEDQNKTVIRAAKADLSAPDGISGYTDLFKLTNTVSNAEIYFRNITLDGGDFTVYKPFTNYTKKILNGWATGTHQTVKVLSFKNCTIRNATSEGISANNYDYSGNKVVEYAEYVNCTFSSNGGASCNVSNSQRIINCRFLNRAWVEHANAKGDGFIEIVGCHFKNASKVNSQTVSVLNAVFPMSGVPTDYAARLGTSCIIKDCIFENDLSWVTGWTGTNPWVQSIGVKGCGTTIIENNLFKNAGYNQNYGGGPIGTYDWLDNIYIRNNEFTITDPAFSTALIIGTYSAAATTTLIDVSGNRVNAEYPINTVSNLYGATQRPMPKRFISKGNYISLPVDQPFTATWLTAYEMKLPALRTYTVRAAINVTTAAPTVIQIANMSSGVLSTVYNATPAGTGTVYASATFTTDNLSTNQYVSTYLVKTSGNVANSFTLEFEEI